MRVTFRHRHKLAPFRSGRARSTERGFTLLELIIVIAIMALVYSVVLPKLNILGGTEISTKVGALAADVRSAYDMAVLNHKPFRLVFHFGSGEYWLETTERKEFFLGDEKLDHDLTETEEKDAIRFFDEDFMAYEELAGQEIEDSANDRVLKPATPLIKAKDKLKPPKWTMVENQEWGKRSLGPQLVIADIQAEHHAAKQTAELQGEETRAFIYFFPKGYVERAAIHLKIASGGLFGDEDEPPYTLFTNPYEGTAEILTGYQELDFTKDADERT